jgi:hypothetical protein
MIATSLPYGKGCIEPEESMVLTSKKRIYAVSPTTDKMEHR